MSAPGRSEPILYDAFQSFGGGIETYAWQEDLDTNAAAVAISAMLGSIYDGLYVGTDSIRTRKGFGTPYLLGIMGFDESGGGEGGYLTVQGRTRAIRFGKASVVAAGEFYALDFTRNPIALPQGNKIDCVCNKSGGGAENHCIIAIVGYPKLPRHPMLVPKSIEGPIGLKTGTRVAETFGPKTSDLLGSNLAYEDSEEAMSEDPSMAYCLMGLINGPGLADTSLVGVRYQRTENSPDLELYVPASAAGSESYIIWPNIKFSAENPAKLGACGHSTTSDEYGLHLGLSVPYGDFDEKNQNQGGSGLPSGSQGSGSLIIPGPITSGQYGTLRPILRK